MSYPSQVYATMLNGLLLSITPALPTGTAGTRPPAGNPETIPDITFIARELTAIEEPDTNERNRLNGFIRPAIAYHKTFGLIPNVANATNPRIIDSFEDILDHFQGITAPYGRIRLVSHGNDAFIFLPLFNNGAWGLGMTADRLAGFEISDVAGLRATLGSSPTDSPTLMDGTTTMFNKIRASNASLLQPFNLHTSGTPSGEFLKFMEVVNDFYQVEHGTIIIKDASNNNAIISNPQRAIFRSSLDIIEADIRSRLEGSTVGSGASAVVITSQHLTDIKEAILPISPAPPISPIDMGFLNATNFTAADITNINSAVGAAAPSIASIRSAFNITGSPIFFSSTGIVLFVLNHLQPALLNLNGGQMEELSDVQTVTDLEDYFEVSTDLFYLRNAEVTVGGTAINNTQRTALRNGLLAIANLLATSIVAGSSITNPQLTALRIRIENFALNESGITGGAKMYPVAFVNGLNGANTSLNATPSFRTKYNHFRSLTRTTSAVDIRGCLVGKTVSFLDQLRSFMGSGINLPSVSAPEWFQMFPAAHNGFPATGNVYGVIDNLVSNGFGTGSNVDTAAINQSFDDWKDLIDFDAHYDFIKDLFVVNPPATLNDKRFNFCLLEWRTFSIGGIPILRIEAERIDDLNTLNLGEIIERFGIIFEIPNASKPNNTVRTRLNTLQPHIVTFKTLHDNITNASAPSQTEIDGFVIQISALVASITGINGFAAPTTPIVPSTLPSPVTLANAQTYAGNLKTYIDSLLNTDLGTFFTAIQTQINHANDEIRYCFNIGSPVIIKSITHPPTFKLVYIISSTNTTTRSASIAKSIRAWMRIQWTGTTAQATTMNAHIDALPINTNNRRLEAGRLSMLVETEADTSDSAINPFPEFQNNIAHNTP